MIDKKKTPNKLFSHLKEIYPNDFILTNNNFLFDIYVSRTTKDLCFKLLEYSPDIEKRIFSLKKYIQENIKTKSIVTKEYYVVIYNLNNQCLIIKL